MGTADGEAPDVTKLQHRGDEDEFSVEELERLKQALVETHPNMNGYWRRIAIKVRTKGEQACFQRVYQSDAYYKHAHSSKHGATANGNGNGSGNGNGNGNGARRRASGEADAGSDIGRLLERRFGERAAAAGRNGDAVDAGVDVNAGVDHRRVRDLVEQELLDEGGGRGRDHRFIHGQRVLMFFFGEQEQGVCDPAEHVYGRFRRRCAAARTGGAGSDERGAHATDIARDQRGCVAHLRPNNSNSGNNHREAATRAGLAAQRVSRCWASRR